MRIFAFWSSRYRKEYCKLAFKYHSTPWSVYQLAHGRKTRSGNEVRILKALKHARIISDIY